MDDTISRRAAIKVLHDEIIKRRIYGDVNDGMLDEFDTESILRALPSAQPEPIRINLNEPIKVKLTDWGKEIFYHQYDRVNKSVGREVCKPKYPTEDENGYTEFQLWCFMELYGEYMGMTLPNVVERFEIVYESAKGGKNESEKLQKLYTSGIQ